MQPTCLEKEKAGLRCHNGICRTEIMHLGRTGQCFWLIRASSRGRIGTDASILSLGAFVSFWGWGRAVGTERPSVGSGVRPLEPDWLSLPGKASLLCESVAPSVKWGEDSCV